MDSKRITKLILAVSCPTCGAAPGQKCELHSGQPRTAPHRYRRLRSMKSRTLTCITAIMLFAALAVPVQLAAQVSGIGITNRIPIWTNSTTLGNSILLQTGGKVGIGTTTPTATLTVIGANGATSGTSAPTVLQVTGGSGAVGFLGINAGAGGPITLTAGPGGHAGRTSSNGGPGGSVLIAGGNGGSGTTCCAGGNGKGGSIILQPGA